MPRNMRASIYRQTPKINVRRRSTRWLSAWKLWNLLLGELRKSNGSLHFQVSNSAFVRGGLFILQSLKICFFASVIQLYLVSERCGKRREKEDPDFRHKTCVVYCDILLPLTQTCIQIRDNCLVVKAFELSRQFPFVLTIQKMLNPTGARSTAIFVERDRIIRRIWQKTIEVRLRQEHFGIE